MRDAMGRTEGYTIISADFPVGHAAKAFFTTIRDQAEALVIARNSGDDRHCSDIFREHGWYDDTGGLQFPQGCMRGT